MMSDSDILTFLSDKEFPVKTVDIAKYFFGNSVSSTKNVNRVLYKLQKEGKLTKLSNSDGTNPRWWLSSKGEPKEDTSDPYLRVKSFIRDQKISDEETVILILRLTEEPVPTLLISKATFGKGATTKLINPLLYSMQKQGKIKKISNEDGTQPRWYIP